MPVGTALIAVQTAITTKLKGDATLTSSATGGIWSLGAVPETQKPPYIIIGEHLEDEADTMSHLGYDDIVTLHFWDESKSWARTMTMMGRVSVLLHCQSLTVSGMALVMSKRIETQTLQDPDGVSLHGIQRYRIYTQEAR